MKRLLALILCLTLLISIAGCKNTEKTPDEEEQEVINETENEVDTPEEAPVDEVSSEEDQVLQEEPVDVEALQAEFDAFIQQVAVDSIASSPLNATFTYGDLDALGLGDLLYHLDDVSYEGMLDGLEVSQSEADILATFDRSLLTEDQQILYDMLDFYIDLSIDSSDFYYYYSEFQPSSGVQVYLPISLMQIELEKESEVEAYLSRLSEVPRFYDQVIEYTMTQADLGLLLPADMYEDVITQIGEMVVDPETFMLYESFIDRVDGLDLDPESADAYKAQCLSIIADEIFPAYDRIVLALESVKDASTTNTGISEWTNGEEYYELLLREKTSYDMDIDTYRNLITNKSIHYSMKIQTMLKAHPELMEMTFEELLPTYESLDDVYAIQEACLEAEFYDYGIENASENTIPAYLEDYIAAGFYFPLTVDGEDYGNMYLGAESYNNVDSSTLELYFHENMPGHHMYFDYLYGSDATLFQKVVNNTAYAEGWATYVQEKTYEYIGFEDYLQEFMFYVGQISSYNMAMMDIYIHVDGISYNEAINILVGLGYPEDMAGEVVNRLVGNPGENIHYTYGNYKVHEYKDQMEEELGDAFDIKDFHDLLLKNANIPFFIMDRIVDDYITEKLEG